RQRAGAARPARCAGAARHPDFGAALLQQIRPTHLARAARPGGRLPAAAVLHPSRRGPDAAGRYGARAAGPGRRRDRHGARIGRPGRRPGPRPPAAPRRRCAPYRHGRRGGGRRRHPFRLAPPASSQRRRAALLGPDAVARGHRGPAIPGRLHHVHGRPPGPEVRLLSDFRAAAPGGPLADQLDRRTGGPRRRAAGHRLEPPRRRTGIRRTLRRLALGLDRHPPHHRRRAGHLRSPPRPPRPAATLDPPPPDPAGRRGRPHVPDRLERLGAGDPGRALPGRLAGADAPGQGPRPGNRAAGVRSRTPAAHGRHRAAQPAQRPRAGHANGRRTRPAGLRRHCRCNRRTRAARHSAALQAAGRLRPGRAAPPRRRDAMTTAAAHAAPPPLEYVATLHVQVGPPQEVGDTPQGRRRVIPILGGRVEGPLLNGAILPGGADFQSIRSATYTDIHARYVIETPTGQRVYVENTGIRTGSADDIARLARGEPVDPARIYFRSYPRFETAAPELAWLHDCLFIGTGARYPDRVELRFYRIG